MPRFLIDENLSPLIAQALRSFGYDAKAVRELGLTGYSDQDIIQSAANNGRIIVTGDIEFGELFYRHYGQISMIVLKNKPADTNGFIDILGYLHGANMLNALSASNHLLLASKGGYRLRKFEPGFFDKPDQPVVW